MVLMGDLNRPLQTPRPSFGTKLLLDWEDTGTVFILNKKEIHTRIDPFTGKGSTLDLGVISENIRKLITSFEVDTNRNLHKDRPFHREGLHLGPGGDI